MDCNRSRPIIELRDMGASYPTIVNALNRGGHIPKRAARWSPMTVKRNYDRESKRPSTVLPLHVMSARTA